ncbi:capsid protein [Crucivirus-183]|nr:capsid protein [Crucivirus-183]
MSSGKQAWLPYDEWKETAAGKAALAKKAAKPSKPKAKKTKARVSRAMDIAKANKGDVLSSNYGARLGAVLGEGAQGLFKAITGYGQYKLALKPKKNSLISMGQSPPVMMNAADGRKIMRHREFLQDIVTGPAGIFTNQSFRINPGDPTTFPWLSTIARCFEEYQIRGMLFEFKSTSGNALTSTNTALGSVIMATQYDSAKNAFTTKSEMENHEYSASAKQSESMMHAIECAPRLSVLPQLYVRSGATPAGTDPRLYDFGLFQIATDGQQGNNVTIGELWVTYEVEFYKAQLSPASFTSPAADHYRMSGDYDATHALSLSPSKQPGSNAGTEIVDGNILAFDADKSNVDYMVMIYWIGTVAAAGWAGPSVVTTNCEQQQVWNGGTNFSGFAPSAGVVTSMNCSIFYKFHVTAPNATLFFTGAPVFPTGTLAGDIWVIACNPAVVTLDTPMEKKLRELEANFERLQRQLTGADHESDEAEKRPPKPQKEPSEMTPEERDAKRKSLLAELTGLMKSVSYPAPSGGSPAM